MSIHIVAAAVLTLLVSAPGALAQDAAQNAAQNAEGEPGLHELYGFRELINCKFNHGIGGLLSADIDGDGRIDLVMVNNAKARIEVLRQRHDGEELPAFEPETYNDLPDEVYFIRESRPTEQKVTSLAVADLDADGLPDMAYLGDSGKLTVAYRSAAGHDTRQERFPISKASDNSDAVQSGDLDDDGRIDLVVLGERNLHVFLQDTSGHLKASGSLPLATRNPDGFSLTDIDGDGRLDLFFLAGDSDWPFRFRLGLTAADGGVSFGPEIRSAFDPVRSYALADVDGDDRSELGVVRRRSGRMALLRYEPSKEEAGLSLSAPRVVPFGGDGERDQVHVDLDGDGLLDILTADAKGSRLVLYRGEGGAQFREAGVFPSFIGVSRPHVADVDGDGALEVVVLAPAEGAVGISEVEADGRVSFPVAHAAPGKDLLALDVTDQDGDGQVEIWVITGDGKSRKRKYALSRIAVGGVEALSFDIDDVDADPNGMLFVDLDRDGFRDVLLLIPTRNPRLMLWRPDGWLDVDVDNVPGLSLLKGLGRDLLSVGDVDGDGLDELLAPGPNFARAFWLRTAAEADPVVEVVGQYNLADSGAKVGSLALGDLEGNGSPQVLMIEKGSGMLHVLRPTASGAEPVARLDLGGFSPDALSVADIDGDGRQDLLLAGGDRFAVALNGQVGPRFVPDREYELPVKNPNLDRLAFGDVNGDGQVDLVVTETSKQLLAIAALRKDAIEHALRFPIFEAKLFSFGRGGREPRELLVADVTGDGLTDVVLVVHDRILVYPQD